MLLIVGLFVIGLVLGFLSLYLIRDPYVYSLTDAGISVKFRRLITLELYFIRYKSIYKIELIPVWKANVLLLIPFLRVGFRWWGKQAVLVRMHEGIFKLLILVPPEPIEFLKSLEKKCHV